MRRSRRIRRRRRCFASQKKFIAILPVSAHPLSIYHFGLVTKSDCRTDGGFKPNPPLQAAYKSRWRWGPGRAPAKKNKGLREKTQWSRGGVRAKIFILFFRVET